jgi:bacteriorhodopsin
MDIILPAGALFFLLSSLYFLVTQKNSQNLNIPFLVSFITLISYLIMWQGSFVTLNSNGEQLYWTRWIGYMFSCTLLMYTIASLIKSTPSKLINKIYLTALVMFTGLLASVSEGNFMLIFFGVSSFAYILLIWPIVTNKLAYKYINYFIVLGWTIFPIAFLLSPEGLGVINQTASAAIYLGLDLFTKIIFYLANPKINLKIKDA